MAQKAVESLIGRLVTDREFRRRFFEEPAAACLGESLDVTTRELEAVGRLEPALLEQFGKRLDATIVRAALGLKTPGGSGSRDSAEQAPIRVRGVK